MAARYPGPPRSNVFPAPLASVAALADPAGQDRHHEHDERREVEQLRQPVPGVREDRHERDDRHDVLSAADSRYMPRSVNRTITISMTICERVASRGSGQMASARSWASTRPATW